MIKRLSLFALTAALVSACASVPVPGLVPTAPHAMVVAANPHAVEAGMAVLRAGGDATDAAIAVAATLTLVEPQSSGLGGGGFMMHYNARTGAVTAFDGREVAPAAIKPDVFLNADGTAKPFLEAARSGNSIGVPGLVAMLDLAHTKYGRKTWAEDVAFARDLATAGFEVSPRMARLIASDPALVRQPWMQKLYFDAQGQPLPTGAVLKNPGYADVLRRLGTYGASSFYQGAIAQTIAAVAATAPDGGTMTLEDMKAYKALPKEALCRPYRTYRICVPPLPGGGVGLLEIMGTLAHTDIAKRGPQDATAWHQFVEAARLMLADRAVYYADPDYAEDVSAHLLNPAYLRTRATLIGTRALTAPPPGEIRVGLAGDPTFQNTGTSHFVVVDSDGDVVSVTQSVEYVFGSGRTAGGMILNNQLTDFSFVPQKDGVPVANRVEGGKRPRSSMVPTLVFDAKGHLVLALGSPGGASIPSYVAKVLVGVLDWGLPLQEAIDLPNIVAKPDSVSAEVDRLPATVIEGLRARGHTVTAVTGEDSGLHAVQFSRRGLVGAADRRREGVVGTE
jgi:gamma-glutamyltranspeptidase/glutathione hydrolase